eukprot:Amastigsp_a180534_5.p4 type:complete len:143 gc:universal Amastigsp_a180534_5:1030-602(-)
MSTAERTSARTDFGASHASCMWTRRTRCAVMYSERMACVVSIRVASSAVIPEKVSLMPALYSFLTAWSHRRACLYRCSASHGSTLREFDLNILSRAFAAASTPERARSISLLSATIFVLAALHPLLVESNSFLSRLMVSVLM